MRLCLIFAIASIALAADDPYAAQLFQKHCGACHNSEAGAGGRVPQISALKSMTPSHSEDARKRRHETAGCAAFSRRTPENRNLPGNPGNPGTQARRNRESVSGRRGVERWTGLGWLGRQFRQYQIPIGERLGASRRRLAQAETEMGIRVPRHFGNVIQYNYPGDDFKDLMAGVDELIARGWVDPQELGVTGGSGGGVLTNWTIGHTDRFKAAVSQRSIADWAGFWYTADFAQFTPFWFRGAPWEQEADYKARSPITYIQNVHTPLMLIEGEADFRTPAADGGEQMFRSLKYLKRTVVMVRFPGESHELSRSGKPVHRTERLEHIVAWFDKYPMGQQIHTYDVK
jgi:hypothetical protein